MGTTTQGLRYPESTDLVRDGALAIRHLAEDLGRVSVLGIRSSGATGDGATDDTVAVQAALNAGSALVRRADVMITEGVFITGSITVPAGRRLVGAGGTIKAKANMASNAQVITLGGEGAAAIGVRLDGNAANQVNGVLGIGAYGFDNITIQDNEIWATSKDAIRTGGTMNNARIKGNQIRDLTITAAGISCLHTGSRTDVSFNMIKSTAGQALLIHGNGGVTMTGLTCQGNTIDCAGQIPLEIFDCTGASITGNVILNGNRGITVGNLTHSYVGGNTMANQTLYAIELNAAVDVTVVGNTALNCASFLHGTSATTGLVNVTIVGNSLVGTGLVAPIVGNAIFKITKADGLTIADNFVRGHQYVDTIVRLGSSNAANNVTVRNNHFIVDTANAGVQCVTTTIGTDVVVRGNRITLTRNLVAGDDNARVIQVSQGAVTGYSCRDNEVVFTGTVAAASSLVAIGTAFSGAGTLPRSSMVNNRVVSGPVGFRADVTSADFLFQDNEGRSCTTEVSNVNAAVIFKRVAREFEGAGAPASGTHVRGDRSWETTPAASGIPGYVCVAGGTPGTWKAMAALAA